MATRAQAPPSGAEKTTLLPQAGREEAQGRAENVDAGRVDKRTKPPVETVLLVDTSYQGLPPSVRPTAIRQVRSAMAHCTAGRCPAPGRPVTYVFDYVFLLTPRDGSVGRLTPCAP
ncbi:hypothetical protein Sfulv_58850 [Streptomyces fulvorobeus]|uniref:Uncharacterized protein n=1 Tax=Streptomyces fulvorobeus TaxID=284028 RepID=A0A7J0CH26_9ACTN|nr:hypothetical protein Sfulv_58850 [Streptomyces fulvorobeus]